MRRSEGENGRRRAAIGTDIRLFLLCLLVVCVLKCDFFAKAAYLKREKGQKSRVDLFGSAG